MSRVEQLKKIQAEAFKQYVEFADDIKYTTVGQFLDDIKNSFDDVLEVKYNSIVANKEANLESVLTDLHMCSVSVLHMLRNFQSPISEEEYKNGHTGFTSIQTEALELFERKNRDYGDSFVTYGPIGVIVRSQDKINRLVNLLKEWRNLTDYKLNVTLNTISVPTESIEDTLLDLVNYSLMGVMLIRDDIEAGILKREL